MGRAGGGSETPPTVGLRLLPPHSCPVWVGRGGCEPCSPWVSVPSLFCFSCVASVASQGPGCQRSPSCPRCPRRCVQLPCFASCSSAGVAGPRGDQTIQATKKKKKNFYRKLRNLPVNPCQPLLGGRRGVGGREAEGSSSSITRDGSSSDECASGADVNKELLLANCGAGRLIQFLPNLILRLI